MADERDIGRPSEHFEKFNELASSVTDTLDRANAMVSRTGEMLEGAVAATDSALKMVGVDTGAMSGVAQRRLHDTRDMAATSIRANPLRSVLIAAGIGYVYGLMRR